MRITNNIIQKNSLAALQVNARALATAQKRVSSGLRVERASDDPIAASSIMESQGSIRAIEQYRRNVLSAQSYTQSEEGALDGLTRLLERAKEIAIEQADVQSNDTTRTVALDEVEQLYKQAIQLGNTRVGNRYLFGGLEGDTAPVTVDGLGDATVALTTTDAPDVQISSGLRLRTNHNAKEALQDTGALGALKGLRDALRTAVSSSDPSGIPATIDQVNGAYENVQNVLGEVGVWSSQFDVTAANLDALEVNLNSFKSQLQEVDLEEAVTELIGRQNAYQAAMMATSRVMGMTLADYLR